MANFAVITLIIVIVALFAQGVIFFLWTRSNENKRRIDELEKAQSEMIRKAQETQLPYTAAGEIMDATAIMYRQKRELELDVLHGEQRIAIAKAKLTEFDRAIDKLKNARGNGQKGNGR